jgi:Zn-dependent M32 family carboxypeptidase
LAKLVQHSGPASELDFAGRKEFGDFLRQEVFRSGGVRPWPEFIRRAVGEPLTARCFAAEVQ